MLPSPREAFGGNICKNTNINHKWEANNSNQAFGCVSVYITHASTTPERYQRKTVCQSIIQDIAIKQILQIPKYHCNRAKVLFIKIFNQIKFSSVTIKWN